MPPTAETRSHFIVCGDNPLAYRITRELTRRYALNVVVLLPDRQRNHGPQLTALARGHRARARRADGRGVRRRGHRHGPGDGPGRPGRPGQLPRGPAGPGAQLRAAAGDRRLQPAAGRSSQRVPPGLHRAVPQPARRARPGGGGAGRDRAQPGAGIGPHPVRGPAGRCPGGPGAVRAGGAGRPGRHHPAARPAGPGPDAPGRRTAWCWPRRTARRATPWPGSGTRCAPPCGRPGSCWGTSSGPSSGCCWCSRWPASACSRWPATPLATCSTWASWT